MKIITIVIPLRSVAVNARKAFEESDEMHVSLEYLRPKKASVRKSVKWLEEVTKARGGVYPYSTFLPSDVRIMAEHPLDIHVLNG
ncbi:hypothetical protein OUZ56_005317 [Daphnia magna]|uniref:Uncharacterized protein n=1 Tax=Daphnia magna TaxID=35525 RepID=A0ABQ9YSI5_9CRUS|nr:hypothetical protein OUZ56_005317 [Daphnia magna]